jgi:hypothetical protein
MRPLHRRYCSAEWDQECIDQKLTHVEVEAMTRSRFDRSIVAGANKRQIHLFALDDPFQSETAFEAQLWLATRKKVAQ